MNPVQGRSAFASDFVGPAFEPSHPEIEIISMTPSQELDMTVKFDKQKASKHARYSPCAAVGMKQIDGDGRHRITFEINDTRSQECLGRSIGCIGCAGRQGAQKFGSSTKGRNQEHVLREGRGVEWTVCVYVYVCGQTRRA